MMRKFSQTSTALCVLLGLLFGDRAYESIAQAQSFRRAGTEFNALRTLTIPAGKLYTVVVVEFYHHGEIRPKGDNVWVVAKNREPAPFRVLQVGPGDFCRLAIQILEGQAGYEIYYGGEQVRQSPPEWTCRDGLLLETRRFQPCNLSNLEAVRRAFEKAEPLGADYVEQVFHAYNPTTLIREPFFSRYTGYMQLRTGGKYGFYTSSQDCSFLLIDEKPVVATPGRHGPMHRARPGSRRDLQLSSGEHKFEYYHAAAGPAALMAALWEIDPPSDKPERPLPIPAEVFRTHLVGRLPVSSPVLRGNRPAPDFLVSIAGDVPLPDNETPLVAVLFRESSPPALSGSGTKYQWDFGDGQTSELKNVDHVYLRPGMYTVKLALRRGGKTVETSNRVYVDRPWQPTRDRPHTLDEYLRIVETYDPRTLDAVSLRQLVLTFEAKALASPDDARQWLSKAVAVGVQGLREGSATGDAEDVLKLARTLASMARRQLGDSASALEIWRAAERHTERGKHQAACDLAAADIALNDLLQTALAKALLQSAEQQFGGQGGEAVSALLKRLWGDYHASQGAGELARENYLAAQRLLGANRSLAETTARQGAYARTVEALLQEKNYLRAAEELEAWEAEFPAAKLEGYWTLLTARYWAGRKMFAQAIAQAERLQAVNPSSPYLDRLLFLAAESELQLGRKDRAVATLHTLLNEHAGSPLVPPAREKLRALEAATENQQ